MPSTHGTAAAASLARAGERTVFELRQYTLKGGTRAEFTQFFSTHFVTSQADVGCHVCAVFRDLDDPDRFVWIRGFNDMAARKTALETFYGGPVWKENKDQANAMMIDSDNVHFLKPITGDISPQALDGTSLVRIAIHRLQNVDPAAFEDFFTAKMQPAIVAAGGDIVATLVTETAANNFPRLPVREHDPVLLWITRFPNESSERAFTARLNAASGWRDEVANALLPALMQKAEILRLEPSISCVVG